MQSISCLVANRFFTSSSYAAAVREAKGELFPGRATPSPATPDGTPASWFHVISYTNGKHSFLVFEVPFNTLGIRQGPHAIPITSKDLLTVGLN